MAGGIELDLADAAATEAAGARLAGGLRAGMVLTFSGALGAGKTTLVRGLLRALGWSGPVKSPTYGWLEHYVVSNLYLYHFDLYRLKKASDWDETGFAEYFRADTVCLIEWPERIGGLLAGVDVATVLTDHSTGRRLALAAHTPEGDRCLGAFRARS